MIWTSVIPVQENILAIHSSYVAAFNEGLIDID